jgi:hypothetical protein
MKRTILAQHLAMPATAARPCDLGHGYAWLGSVMSGSAFDVIDVQRGRNVTTKRTTRRLGKRPT